MITVTRAHQRKHKQLKKLWILSKQVILKYGRKSWRNIRRIINFANYFDWRKTFFNSWNFNDSLHTLMISLVKIFSVCHSQMNFTFCHAIKINMFFINVVWLINSTGEQLTERHYLCAKWVVEHMDDFSKMRIPIFANSHVIFGKMSITQENVTYGRVKVNVMGSITNFKKILRNLWQERSRYWASWG